VLLASLAARDPREPALSPDGDTWLDVGRLLSLAQRAAAGRTGAHRGSAVPVRTVSGSDPVAAVVELLAAQLTGSVAVVAADGLAPDARDHLLSAAGDPSLSTRGGGEPLLVVVTSGTTGRPRAVVRSAGSWHRSLAAFDALLGPGCPPGTVVWGPGAPASTLTLFALWHALSTGRPVVASGRWRAPSAGVVGRDAVAVQCVPAVLGDILAARESGALPELRHAVVAGAASPPGLASRAAAAGVALVEYYGAAELSFVAADVDGTGLRAFPGAEVAVRGGRIAVRSPYVALGYLPADDDGPLRREAGGWASVGDRGALDAEGRLQVLGRGDAVASVGGHVVLLDDVERALADVPGVAELVCLAEPDPRLGSRVVAVVRPGSAAGAGPSAPEASGREASGREASGRVASGRETSTSGADLRTTLRKAARARLPRASRPVRYVLRDDLPRTPGGKVARGTLLAEVTRPAVPDTARTPAS
jgi:acyl-CoA synthetase (AMP-forming)/AMP-acid ligase II